MKLTKYTKQAIVSRILNDVPKPDDNTLKADIQAAMVKAMTPGMRKLYKTKPTALKIERISGYDVGASWAFDVIVADVRDMDVREVLKPFKAAHEERKRVREQLRFAIETCTTLKQLNERLPEFSRYYPTAEKPTANLPALANVVADLSKLGWPKQGAQT